MTGDATDATDTTGDDGASESTDSAESRAALSTVSHGDARDLLVDLVATPSPSGEERAAAEHLVAFFEAHGREAWLDGVGNVRAPADDAVLLTSHVDTVPGDVPVRVEDGVLWGRGSVDATGPLAAMAVAAVETGVSFAGVVGEETDSRGAHHLVADREAPDAVVNGEPSGWDALTLGYRGFLAGTYETETEGMHTSRPEPNAVEEAMAWWRRVTAALDAGGDGPDGETTGPSVETAGDSDGESTGDSADPAGDSDETPVFERVTAKPVAFEGGVAEDGLAVTATVDAQFRVPPSRTVESMRATVEGELDDGTVTWRSSIPPTVQSPRTPVARAFRVAIREAGGSPRLVRKTGTSDVNVYDGAWNCPMATYGPGDSALDHAPDERLSLAEYDRAIGVLVDVCERLQ
ncbi:MAG: M20/M25/M40 family metallo-hydrolase [Haloferacaceae archaeon]